MRTIEATPARRRVLACAAAAVLLTAAVGENAGAATLRWKFKAGESLHYQMDQKTVTTIKLAGQEIKTTLNQTVDSTWSVESVAADGSAQMSQTIERIRTKIEAAFGSIEYDSASGKEPTGPIAQGILPALKALVGAKFRYKMSPLGELSDVVVAEGLVDKLKESAPASGGAAVVSEERLKDLIHQSSLPLPAEDLVKDKSWTRIGKVPSGPIGELNVEKIYKYEGPADGGDKIGLTLKITIQPPENAAFTVKLGKQTGGGNFVFNNESGRVVSSIVTQNIEMTVSTSGQEFTQANENSTSMKLVEVKAATSTPKPAGESK
ncbi:MAG: DUF6263 family protein [Isosphaeraceae bacterium]